MSNVHVIGEREIPETPPQYAAPPQPQAPNQMPAIYAAIGHAIAGRLHGLLLILAAIAVGLIVVTNPTDIRCYAGAGYGLFTLMALVALRR